MPTDSFERLLQKAVSLISQKLNGAYAPLPTDSNETLMFKFVSAFNELNA